MEEKSNHILKAIDAGYSCEQILASDRALTYHDIFHAVTEAPTSHWRRAAPPTAGTRPSGDATSSPSRVRRRRD